MIVFFQEEQNPLFEESKLIFFLFPNMEIRLCQFLSFISSTTMNFVKILFLLSVMYRTSLPLFFCLE